VTPVIPRLYFVRHGETDWNAEHRFQGQRDVPLNDLGRVQADACGGKLQRLAARDGLDIADLAYVASPMLRTRETMEILRTALGLHPPYFRQDDRLKEMSFGTWEGQTVRELALTDPDGMAARKRDRWTWKAPGGESYVDVTDRIRPVLTDIERPSVVVAHGGIARALFRLLDVVDQGEAMRMEIAQGVVYVIADGRLERV
jgi:probable phosphoglycerate mutase